MSKITIPTSVNEKTTLSVTSGQTVVLPFEPATATFERNENDLAVTPKGGQTIILSGFFAVGDKELPSIQLTTGEELNAKDFLASAAPDIDITTAAGTSSQPSSSGGQYEDGTGELIGGVDRLGSLGTTQWSVTREASSLDLALGAGNAEADAPFEGEGLPPVTGGNGEGGDLPGGGDDRMFFNARAVLYAHDAINDPAVHTNHNVTAAALTLNNDSWGPTGDANGVSVSYLGGDNASYLAAPVINPDGTITFVLTPEAIGYFTSNPGADPLEFYYTVTVGGVAYTVQVVVPYNESSFDSGWYDNNAKYGRLDGELIYGESHKGHSDSETAYNVISSNKSDELLFEGNLTGSDIKTGYDSSGNWGDDKVTVDGGMIATGTAPDGASGNNSIITGNGTDTVIITGGIRAEQTAGHADNASNTVDTGKNDGDKVAVEGGVYAMNSDSANSISSTHATITPSGDVVKLNDWLSIERLSEGDPYNEFGYPEHHLNQNGLSALNQEGYGVTSNTLDVRDQVVITVRGGAMSAGIATEALFGGEANNTVTVSGSNQQWAVDIQSGALGDDNLAMGVYTRGPGATTVIDATNPHADQDMSGIRIVARNGGTDTPNVDLGGLAGGLLTSAVTTTGLLPFDDSAYPIPHDQPSALTKITASGNIELLAESDGLREVVTVATHYRATTEIISTDSDITVEGKGGIAAYAFRSSGIDSKTTFMAENGSVLLGAYSASAHAANTRGDLTITAGKNITIEAVSEQGLNAYGVQVMAESNNAINLTAGNLLSIQATGALWAYGTLLKGGAHSFSGRDVEILAQSIGGDNAACAVGLSNYDDSELTVEATAGSVNINAEGGERTTTALVTGGGSFSTIRAADNINITATGSADRFGTVAAVVSDTTSTTILDAKGDITLKALGNSASPTYGVMTDHGSDTNIWATGNIDITAEGGTSAFGANGDNLSTTVLATTGDNSDIIINAISGKTQYDGTAIDGGGIRMDNGSDAIITADKGDIRINAEGMNAAGVSANHSSTVSLSAEELHIKGKGIAYGAGIEAEQSMYNTFTSRVDAIAQGDISITGESEGNAMGAYTGEPYGGGHIRIESQKGDITIAAHGLTDDAGNIVMEAYMASGIQNNVTVVAKDGDIDISGRAAHIAHGVYGNVTVEAMGHAIAITGKSWEDGTGIGSAYGVTTQFGKSIIRTADVHDTVLTGNVTILADAFEGGGWARGVNVLDDLEVTAGSLEITAKAGLDTGSGAFGIETSNSSYYTPLGEFTANDITVTATSSVGAAHGVFAGGDGPNTNTYCPGENVLTARNGDITVTATGAISNAPTSAYASAGIYTDWVSINTLKTENGDIKVTATGTANGSGTVGAVVSDHTSTTILDAKGDITLKALGNSASPTYGVMTDHGSDTNIWATGNIDITAEGGTSAFGANGDNLSTTVLATTGDNSDIIINAISGKTQYDGTAIDGGGIRMDNGSDAIITADKGDIRINAEGMNAAGVSANHSSTVSLSAEEIHIKAKGTNYGVGIEAEQDPYNTFASRVDAIAQGDISITGESELSAMGAYTGEPYDGGQILIESQTGDIRIAAHGLTDAAGNVITEADMASGIKNKVAVIARDGDIDISGRAAHIAHGVYGNVTVEAMDHAITITGKSVDNGNGIGWAHGVTAQFGKASIRTADMHDAVLAGNITILADASEGGGWAHGVNVGDDLEVTTGSLEITAMAGTNAGSSSFGIRTSNGSYYTPKGEFTANDITVTATSSLGAAHGIFAGQYGSNSGTYCSGENVLTARNGDITVTATGAVANTPTSAYAAAGIYTYWGSTNTLKTENGDIKVTATGSAGASANGSTTVGAVITGYESTTILDAKGDVTLQATGNSSGLSYGVFTQVNSVTNIMATDNISITAKDGQVVFGIRCLNNDFDNASTTTIQAENGNITVKVNGISSATGVFGSVLLEALDGEVTIDASGTDGNAVGISNGVVINASDVTIKAVSDLSDIYSAMAVISGSGAINQITGASSRESVTVTITAKAGGFDGVALLAQSNGMNIIRGGDESDRVEINGAVRAEGNGISIIDTGDGNDIIRLNGQVNYRSLDVRAGDGYDVLVLSAASMQEFTDNYATWLSNLTDVQLQAMSIECFRISSGLDPNDPSMSWFTDFINRYENVTGIRPDVQWDTLLDDGSIASYANIPVADTGYDVHVSGQTLADAHDTLTLGDGDDWVRVDGDLVSGLDLGDGHNNLRVDGSVASSAEILMGADEDVLTVNGGVTGGVINMGAGNDSAAISGGVSNATIDMGDGDNYLHLSGSVTGSTIEGGSGDNILHYSFNGNAGDIISLLDNNISGFSSLVLDMTDDKASTLSLDNLLDDLFAAKQNNTDIYIRGDAEDSLNLTGWTADPSANVQGADGYAYEAYTYVDNGDTLTIYVQSQIQTG